MTTSTTVLNALKQDFLTEILQKKLKISPENFTIESFELTSATGKQDNFISDVYRLKIKVQVHEAEKCVIDFIMKVSENVTSDIKQLSVFTREQLVYEDMIVDFERIWKESGQEVKLAPECYKVTEAPYEIIVLEDLKAEGFGMASKKDGLNLDETKFCLSKLAKFHAASAVRYVRDNKNIHVSFDRAANHVKHLPDSPVIASMRKLFNKLVDVAKFLNTSADKIIKLPLDALLDSYFDVTHPMKCGLRVLVHADLWTNNILFRRDSRGNVVDARIIDFQMCFWGSPNADLIYMLFTSVMDDVKVRHFNEIIEFYYGELREALATLKYEGDIPNVEELKDDFMKNKLYAIQLFLHIIPMTRNCSSATLNIADLFSGRLTEEDLSSVFMEENVLKVMGSWLPFMDEQGFFDMN